MGIFDALKEMKARYDELAEEKKRKEEERIRHAQEEREREKREAEEKERMILDKLASGELMQSLLHECQAISWLGESQGSWDSNRRQFIITPVALVVNNHDQDLIFRCLEEIKSTGSHKFSYSLHFKDITDRTQMEKYEKLEGFQWTAMFYESYGEGYSAITETDTLRYFTMALRREISKQYPTGAVSDMRENNYRFWWFEIVVEPKKQKSVL